jgi:peptidoglycan/xylan/chitin deacetylase (PgdA/CDA1 family)
MRRITLNNPVLNVVRAPAILITFDDGYTSHYTQAFSYMNARNLKGTLYINTDTIDTAGFMTTAQLTTINAAGWDIANHTSDHTDLTTLSQANAEIKLTTAQTWLDANGFSRASKHVCYPSGGVNATVLAAMDNLNMLTGRGIVEAKEMITPSSIYLLNSYQLATTKSLAQCTALVDTAISENRLLSIYMHDIATPAPHTFDWTIADFQAFINYVVSSGIRAITINELYTGTLS